MSSQGTVLLVVARQHLAANYLLSSPLSVYNVEVEVRKYKLDQDHESMFSQEPDNFLNVVMSNAAITNLKMVQAFIKQQTFLGSKKSGSI